MNFFTFGKLGRTLLSLTAVVAIGAVCWLGCGGGDDNNPADNNGNNSGNGNNTGGNNNNGGGTYDFVEIGGLKWMTKNMNIAIGNSWCYGNDNSNCDKYGRLYDWNTARGVCPSGWHLPNLDDVINGEAFCRENDCFNSDFFQSQKGSGYRGYDGGFVNIGIETVVWADYRGIGTGLATNYSQERRFTIRDVDDDGNRLGYGFSVRCVSNL